VRPKLELLSADLVARIVNEAFELLINPGIAVSAPGVVEMLSSAGAKLKDGRASIPESLGRKALETVPHAFDLYDRRGNPVVHYGGDTVHFDPGSSCLKILDPETLTARLAVADDLARLVKVTEMLPQYAAQATAMVCSDAAQSAGDWYRLLLVLWYSEKPVVTGAFSAETLSIMLELLRIETGGDEALRKRPRAIFDVCPSPPLNWSEFAALNMVQLARAGVPAQMVPMPMAGATAPITLVGSVVQHTAEAIAGIVIQQLAAPGAPVVWGGAPTMLDMQSATTPMAAMETAMLNAACAQVGKSFGLPTHGYLCSSDSKLVDAQAGLESGMTALVGALAGINMISGAGMLDFLACHSVEKLVIDAEVIGAIHRLLSGIGTPTETLATAMFAAAGACGDFLSLPETLELFRSEQHFPSAVIDRSSSDLAGGAPATDTFARARQRTEELLNRYRRPGMPAHIERQLLHYATERAREAGMESLPGLGEQSAPVTAVRSA
jgi:trimethylamine--corrinoid protein Co-methyltransferase